MKDERLGALRQWLGAIPGLDPASLRPASADASFRRYFRVDGDEGSVIAMDAPPQREDSEPFVRVAGYLEQLGLNAPRILAADLEQGFLLLSDLGDTHYLAGAGEDNVDKLYRHAIDALCVLQQQGDRFRGALPPYDTELLSFEMSLFHDWLCQRYLELEFDTAAEAAWRSTVDTLVANALDQPRVFVHRDYHSRNLMVAGDDSPGILDFQDAMNGPLTYDLVSLLKDCYVRWPRARREDWFALYAARADIGVDSATLRRWFDLMGMQRHLKAAGIFARLFLRDGKPGYLKDIPRTLAYITELADDYDELCFVAGWIEDRVLPALDRKQ